tara:strand:+ start:661 stop:1521 length:861 start_codon:yes stop_codon:yes gene_type:complete
MGMSSASSSETTASRQWHTTVEREGLRADACLSELSGLSKSKVKEVMSKGAAWITRGRRTQRLRRASRLLSPGDELHLYVNPSVLAATVTTPTLIADRGGYSVWDKPAGMLSQGSKWGDHCTLPRHAEVMLQPERNAFVVHRLDRAASGLMLLAHSKRVAKALAAHFQARALIKRYNVRVEGYLETPADGLRMDSPLDDRSAASVVRTICATNQQSLLEVSIETGRKHQIRRHLQALGHPVIGDRLYGSPPAHDAERPDLQLRAVYLEFACPEAGEQVTFSVEGLA